MEALPVSFCSPKSTSHGSYIARQRKGGERSDGGKVKRRHKGEGKEIRRKKRKNKLKVFIQP